MEKSPEHQEYKGFEVSRVTFPAELKDHLLREGSKERIDLKVSLPRFIELLNEEIQGDCPGAVADLDIQWDATDDDARGYIVSGYPTDMDEEEGMEKSDAVASAMYEAFTNVKLEYDWEVFQP